MIQSSTCYELDHGFDLFAILQHFLTVTINRNIQVTRINKGRDIFLTITLETFAVVHMKIASHLDVENCFVSVLYFLSDSYCFLGVTTLPLLR